MNDIDVVMLAYNFSEDLVQLTNSAINSLKKGPMGKLIIVDNASSMGGGILREEADVYVRNKTNLGYPAAINQGVALSKAKAVVLANNDIRVTPNWQEVGQGILDSDDKVGTVHYRMIPYEQPFNPGNESWTSGKERWCTSSFFIVRRDAFQGYDENYGAGGYDDYSHHFRMRSAGWKQAYTNKAEYQHMDSITYRTMEEEEKRAERDKKNREYYKEMYGEYPDEQFARQFPEQMSVPWRPFP